MIYIFIILSCCCIMIPMILTLLTNKSYSKRIIKECSQVYGIELNTIKHKYSLIEDEVKKYPLMNTIILRAISLEENSYIDIDRLVLRVHSILDIRPLINSIDISVEIESCDNKHVISLFNEVQIINKKIIKVKFPIKNKLNYFIFKIQFGVILIIVKIFDKFKTLSKTDIENFEKDSEYSFDSSLGLLK